MALQIVKICCPTRRRSRPSLRLGVKAPRVFVGVCRILNLHKHSRLGGSAPGRWAQNNGDIMYKLLFIFILIQVSILISLIIILITKKNRSVSLIIEKYLNVLLLILNLVTIYFNPLSLIIILLLLINLFQIKIKNENLRIILSSASLFISFGVYIITILGMYFIWYVFG
jgi:hypothetical protein